MSPRYACSDEKAAELASRASLLVASGIHLSNYGDGALRGDARAALEGALSDLCAASRAARREPSVMAGICAAAADWQQRLHARRDDPAREQGGVAVIDALLESSATAGALDALVAVANGIESGSADLYEHNWPAPEIVIASLREHPRREADPYGIAGVTETSKDGVAVRLQIHVETFGPEALAAAAGVLAHECVCHVATQPVERADNESVFAEGFMDWAASYFLSLWSARLPGELGTIVESHSAHHRAILVRGSSPAATARKGGRHAAQRIADRLHRAHGEPPPKACRLVAYFAARLNATAIKLSKKDERATGWQSEPDGPLAPVLLDCIHGKRPLEDLF